MAKKAPAEKPKPRRTAPTPRKTSRKSSYVGKAKSTPTNTKRRRRVLMGEIGSTGLGRWAGTVDQEFLRELTGKRGIRTFTEMRFNDDIVGAMLFAMVNLMRGVEWDIETSDDDVGEFVHQALYEDMSYTWQDTMTEILTFLPFGWSWMEMVFKVRGGDTDDSSSRSKFSDGRIGFRKWAIRGQDTLDRWVFDSNGGIQAMQQRVNDDRSVRTIPMAKSLLFRTTAERNNPEGRSILRNAYRAWWFKKHIQQIEGIGIERDLAGYPYIQVAEDGPDVWNANIAEMVTLKDALEEMVQTIKRDESEGAVLPSWAELKLLSAGGRRAFDTSSVIARYDQAMAQSVLADFILIGHDAVGSKALVVSRIGLFTRAVTGYLDSVASVINRFAIPLLLKVNGMTTEEPVEAVHRGIDTMDIDTLSGFLQKLASSGAEIFPDGYLTNHLLRRADLPTGHRETEEGDPKPTDEQEDAKQQERDDKKHEDAKAQAALQQQAQNPPQPEEPPQPPPKAGSPPQSKDVPSGDQPKT